MSPFGGARQSRAGRKRCEAVHRCGGFCRFCGVGTELPGRSAGRSSCERPSDLRRSGPCLGPSRGGIEHGVRSKGGGPARRSSPRFKYRRCKPSPIEVSGFVDSVLRPMTSSATAPVDDTFVLTHDPDPKGRVSATCEAVFRGDHAQQKGMWRAVAAPLRLRRLADARQHRPLRSAIVPT